MSRVGSFIISTKGVNCSVTDNSVIFQGSLGKMEVATQGFKIKFEDENLSVVKPEITSKANLSLWGTIVRLLNNAVIGVSKGFEKKLKLSGVGYKVVFVNDKMTFQVGLSHEVVVEVPERVVCTVPNATTINLMSCDKQIVGAFARYLTTIRKYNVYNGNGILLDGLFYRRKETKRK